MHNSLVDQALSLVEQQGVILLQAVLDKRVLSAVAQAATQCFVDIERIIQDQGADQVRHQPSFYSFKERCTSVNLLALRDYLVDCQFEQAPHQILANSSADRVLRQLMGNQIVCNLNQAWVRKQYAFQHYHSLHMPHSWHQDGGLGVTFHQLPSTADQPYLGELLTPLITCWIPLTDCGVESPGLQLITRRLDQLMHYQYLNDAQLSKLFEPDEFWTPEMTLGDVLIFLKGTLHRTHVNQHMQQDRLSLEFRLMRPEEIPDWMQKDLLTEF